MTDMTFNEGLSILGFVCGLFFSLLAWTVLGSLGVELSNRLMGTLIGLGAGFSGVTVLAVEIHHKIIVRKGKHNKPSLKILDLESSGLSEYSLIGNQNLGRIQKINLGLNKLKTIDLTPLTGSTSLKELILYMNHLETIDLTPLVSCPNLEYLDLTDNALESIDITPLSSCSKLNALNIGLNQTSKIDLSPLAECRNLKILTIDGMKLTGVDLSPLRACTELEFLKLDDNEFETLDITPLFECEKLTEFNVDKIDLITTIPRDIEDWPKGIRKHKKKIR